MKNKKIKWQELPWFDECDNCGSSDIEALTDCKTEGHLNEDDLIRCKDCDQKGVFTISDEPFGSINWTY